MDKDGGQCLRLTTLSSQRWDKSLNATGWRKTKLKCLNPLLFLLSLFWRIWKSLCFPSYLLSVHQTCPTPPLLSVTTLLTTLPINSLLHTQTYVSYFTHTQELLSLLFDLCPDDNLYYTLSVQLAVLTLSSPLEHSSHPIPLGLPQLISLPVHTSVKTAWNCLWCSWHGFSFIWFHVAQYIHPPSLHHITRFCFVISHDPYVSSSYCDIYNSAFFSTPTLLNLIFKFNVSLSFAFDTGVSTRVLQVVKVVINKWCTEISIVDIFGGFDMFIKCLGILVRSAENIERFHKQNNILLFD